MAQTANTGFRFFRNLQAIQASPVLSNYLIANSTTLRIGDAVRINSAGFITNAGAGVPVLGVVHGFVDNNGINVLGFGISPTTGATLTGDDQVATASDNQTRASAVYAQIALDPSGNNCYINKTDGALTVTNLFQFFDNDSNSRQIATGSASDTGNTWQLIALDPESSAGAPADTAKGLFRLVENQLASNVPSYNSTAVINS